MRVPRLPVGCPAPLAPRRVPKSVRFWMARNVRLWAAIDTRAQGVAAEENRPGIAGISRVCPTRGRAFYTALGTGNIRRRRITSKK